MTDSRYDRFRRLERPRSGAPEPAPTPSGTDARIEAVRGPVEEAVPSPGAPAGTEAGAASEAESGGGLDRFRAAPERGLELDLADHDSQPFTRCAACETDNFRTAARCTTCGADLDTDEQRGFNQRFWAARQAEAAVEAEASAARQATLDEELSRAATLRREAAESMARAVGDAERERLEREGFSSGWGSGSSPLDWPGGAGTSSVPIGIRWLRLLPAGWPVPAGVALMLLPVLLSLVFMPAGLLIGAVVLALFSPPRWRSRFGSRFG